MICGPCEYKLNLPPKYRATMNYKYMPIPQQNTRIPHNARIYGQMNDKYNFSSNENSENFDPSFVINGICRPIMPEMSPDGQFYQHNVSFSQSQLYDQNIPYNSQIMNTPEIPSTTCYPGQFNFEVSFSQPEKETKSTSWTYSNSLHKVYVRPFCQCPIRFRCSTQATNGCYIRAMPVYMKPEHVKEIVTRCPNHVAPDKANPMSQHLVLCSDNNACYFNDNLTKRQSVIVPFSAPHPGCEWLTFLYKFMCYGSCTGGLNRRPIQLVFTLENKAMAVIGRQVVEVRVCACPGRDRRSDENAFDDFHHKKERKVRKTSPKLINEVNSETQEEFNLPIKGLGNYQLLKGIRDYLYFISNTNLTSQDCQKPEKFLVSNSSYNHHGSPMEEESIGEKNNLLN